ncbi:hypothetical protein ACFWTC_34680 [Streptomyces sp. NPDC058619]
MAIVGTLVVQPEIVYADELTGSLDRQTGRQIVVRCGTWWTGRVGPR